VNPFDAGHSKLKAGEQTSFCSAAIWHKAWTFARSEVVTDVLKMIRVFGDTTPYKLVNSCRHFRDACCLYLQRICSPVRIFLGLLIPKISGDGKSYPQSVMHRLSRYNWRNKNYLRIKQISAASSWFRLVGKIHPEISKMVFYILFVHFHVSPILLPRIFFFRTRSSLYIYIYR
jgi:hypothetical protein